MDITTEEENYPDVIRERLGIEVTTLCNIDCLHCFVRAGTLNPESLSLDLVKQIVAEGYRVGYRHLHITGGEPLLWKGLFEALDCAFDSGYISVFLNTNGTFLTEDVTHALARYNGLSISVSLEGTPALHEYLRGKHSYTRTLAGIGRAVDSGIHTSIFTTACKSLLPELSQFADSLYDRFPGVEDLTLIQLIPVMNGPSGLSEELLEPEDLLQLVDMASFLNLSGKRTRFLNNPLAYVASKLLKLLWVLPSEPLYSNGSMIVMANQDICLSHSTRESFGKYKFGMIQKVLASEAYRAAVAPNASICPSCKYADLCPKNGMIRPSEWYLESPTGLPYCQEVLDGSVK
jgi:MoaA/NifB/PqqE/SkfB family radical SAM enzyme